MASLRAYALNALLHRFVKDHFERAKDARYFRAIFDRIFDERLLRPRRGVHYTSCVVGGVACERVVAGPNGRPRLFYLHGGGFVAMSSRMYRPLTGAFALRGFDVLAADYRLAPEHPFPAALDDVVAAWRAFSREGPAAIAGDSAGGNLALALMIRAREEGFTPPIAAALFSPVTDLLGTGRSQTENSRHDAILSGLVLQRFVGAYLAGADAAHPHASPLRGALHGLPRLLIHVGAREVLRDDAVRLATEIRSAGGQADLKLWDVVPHGWQFADPFLPEARLSLDEAARFLLAPTL